MRVPESDCLHKQLESENGKLTKERDALEYRVKHMKEALKQYSDGKK